MALRSGPPAGILTAMDIAIPIFDRITALDAVGPYEVLSRLPGARVRFIALTPGPYRTDNRQLTLMADEPLSAVPSPEIVMVPGGFGTRALMTPNPLLDWIRGAHATSQWTTSVCTGSLLLGAAGVLKGLEATTPLGVAGPARRPRRPPHAQARGGPGQGRHRRRRVLGHRHGAGAGGADCRRRGRAGRFSSASSTIPQPPFTAGSPETAPPQIVARLRERTREQQAAAGG